MTDELVVLTTPEAPTSRRTCDPTMAVRLANDDAVKWADVFKALSHPVRLQMLDLISQGEGETCACDIERHFDLTQPTISHQLKVLRDAGLITSEARGVWVHHHLDAPLLAKLQDVIAGFQTTD